MTSNLCKAEGYPQGKCNCKFCPLSESGVAPDLVATFTSEMISSMLHQELAKGSSLYSQDDCAEYIYVIHDGVVKLEQRLPTGEHRILRLLRKGDISGIESITAQRYQHDATALTRLLICKIPSNIAFDLARQNHKLVLALLDNWQQALVTTELCLTNFSTGYSRHRVARLLIWLAENSPEHDFFIPNRKDIGLMLGMTQETASRIIADMRREKKLSLLSDGRAIADVSTLKKLVNESAEV